MHYGFLNVTREPEEYVFGSGELFAGQLELEGQWDTYLPQKELQSRNFDSYNCTGYNVLDCVETLLKRVFGLEENYSERALGIAAGTRPPGNNLQKVCETIRKFGLIRDELLPFSSSITTLEEYYSPDPLSEDLKVEATKWITSYTFKHDWVFPLFASQQKKHDLLKEALKYSPLAVSVYGWRLGDNGLYYKLKNDRDNHLTMMYGYQEGEFWKIYDSYDHTYKKLSWDYAFTHAKRFSITPKGVEKSLISKLLAWFTSRNML